MLTLFGCPVDRCNILILIGRNIIWIFLIVVRVMVVMVIVWTIIIEWIVIILCIII